MLRREKVSWRNTSFMGGLLFGERSFLGRVGRASKKFIGIQNRYSTERLTDGENLTILLHFLNIRLGKIPSSPLPHGGICDSKSNNTLIVIEFLKIYMSIFCEVWSMKVWNPLIMKEEILHNMVKNRVLNILIPKGFNFTVIR